MSKPISCPQCQWVHCDPIPPNCRDCGCSLDEEANQARDAEIAFMELAKKEFPSLEDDNDSIAENLTYGGFSNDIQTRKRLTEILSGEY